jgi:hypothetical protein
MVPSCPRIADGYSASREIPASMKHKIRHRVRKTPLFELRVIYSLPVSLICIYHPSICVICPALFYPHPHNHPNNIGSRRRWVDNIKMDFREIGWSGVIWFRIGTSGGLL